MQQKLPRRIWNIFFFNHEVDEKLQDRRTRFQRLLEEDTDSYSPVAEEEKAEKLAQKENLGQDIKALTDHIEALPVRSY
jgi:hypothetical protein